MRKNKRSNFIMMLAAVLLCMTLFSIRITAGLYARFVTTAEVEDDARVAVFNIEQEGTLSEMVVLKVYPGYVNNSDYAITLKSSSEVAVRYTVLAELLTNNLPLSITLTGGEAVTGADNCWTDSGTFEPNSTKELNYILNVAWPAHANNAAYCHEIDALRIVVRAEQID